MNWERGFRRASYLLLGLIFLLWGFFATQEGGAVKLGEHLVYMLFFAGGYWLLFSALVWIFRGFKRDDSKQPTAR